MSAPETEFKLELSRRRLLAAAGLGGATVAASLVAPRDGEAAPAAREEAGPLTAPAVAGLALEFGGDGTTEVVVSWQTVESVRRPRVLVGRLDGKLEQTIDANEASYTDAKSGQAVYVYHVR